MTDTVTYVVKVGLWMKVWAYFDGFFAPFGERAKTITTPECWLFVVVGTQDLNVSDKRCPTKRCWTWCVDAPSLLAFLGICLVIISEWPPLSHTLLWLHTSMCSRQNRPVMWASKIREILNPQVNRALPTLCQFNITGRSLADPWRC